MRSPLRDRIETARARFVGKLKQRGARRERSPLQNLRKVGLRTVVEASLLGALDLLIPEPADDGATGAGPVLPPNPAFPVMTGEPPERFLWLDRPGYEAELQRRLDARQITADEAAMLDHWAKHGYLVIPQAISHGLIDRALADVDRVWRDRQHVMIDVLTDGRRTYVDELDGAQRKVPHKLNDLYLISQSALEIFMNEKITRVCELIFGQPVIGCNSLTFEYGSQQPAHIDHVYMTPSLPRRLVASWIALEDVRQEAGPLQLWSGSHKLPPFDFGSSYHYKPELEARHTEYVAAEKERFPSSLFFAKKGDVLLWHGLFVHGGSPISNPAATRKSMACHYFSREVVPGNQGLKPLGKHFYMTKGLQDPA